MRSWFPKKSGSVWGFWVDSCDWAKSLESLVSGHLSGETFSENLIWSFDVRTYFPHKYVRFISCLGENETADRRRYESTTHCRSCNIFFDSSTIKCRDHDHFTSKFRGALCANCNLQKKNLLFIPLYAHNLRKFDSHLIIKAKTDKSIPMSTLSNNREQVITITLGNIFSFFY